VDFPDARFLNGVRLREPVSNARNAGNCPLCADASRLAFADSVHPTQIHEIGYREFHVDFPDARF
jgi:hypothetical protein